MPPTTTTTIIVTASVSPTTTSSSPTTSASAPSKSPNVGAIVGGLFAGIVAAFLVAGIGYLVYKRFWRRSRRNAGSPRNGMASRSRRVSAGEGSHPLLDSRSRPQSQVTSRPGLVENEYQSYSDPSFIRPVHPASPTTYPRIDFPFEPRPSSSSMMREISTPVSPSRPSLPPLVIPSQSTPPRTAGKPPAGSSEHHHHPTSDTARDDNDDNDDDLAGTSARSSPSLYSQTSASTRFHGGTWETDTIRVIPPVPPIPSQYRTQPNTLDSDYPEEEGASLIRGNTEKLSRLLQSRARRARARGSGGGGGGLSRSGTHVSHIERRGSLRSVSLYPINAADEDGIQNGDEYDTPRAASPSRDPSLTIRNPFENASSSRSTSVTTNATSIANHTAYAHSSELATQHHPRRLSVIDNEDAERESLHADEISTAMPGYDSGVVRPLKVTKITREVTSDSSR
ncbi:hypothetical protein GYMLUDRAFT_244107 [Collybiopsis luxurians FD-317 M1]|uniref:Uncharacterized protein n=1 Tax=Collybiopsis luxurians FD-317 M1 TaxID=944289 RepID=A0A0D0BYR5_9AGAR|nr:hypothetical protein GYMLUDRAFT_244107 [Collybiopsis luxurians FD-317 M1]